MLGSPCKLEYIRKKVKSASKHPEIRIWKDIGKGKTPVWDGLFKSASLFLAGVTLVLTKW